MCKGESLKMRVNRKQWPLFNRLSKSSVCIRMEDGHVGTGVVIEKSGLIITAWHVIEGNQRPYVHRIRLNRQKETMTILKRGYRAELVTHDPEADIAIIRVLRPLKKLQAIRIGYSRMTRGAPLYRIGMDDSDPLANGYLLDWEKWNGMYMMKICMPAAPGCSGGGIFDINGKLVGIALMAIYDELEPSCCFALPIHVILTRPLIRNVLSSSSDLYD